MWYYHQDVLSYLKFTYEWSLCQKNKHNPWSRICYHNFLYLRTDCVYVCVLGHVQLFATPYTVACQASLFMEFSRQEYLSELPFPPPGDLPDLGIRPTSLASPALAGRFFTTESFGKPAYGCVGSVSSVNKGCEWVWRKLPSGSLKLFTFCKLYSSLKLSCLLVYREP